MKSQAASNLTLSPSAKRDKQGGSRNNLPESQVIKIWQYLLMNVTELTTEDGEPIRIIYPGRTNYDRGADFRDAVIATERGLVKGDIEVHVKTSNWREHRHHLDPVYNRVVLHVVMWHNKKAATTLQNGSSMPTLAIDKYLTGSMSRWLNAEYPQAPLSITCLEAKHSLNPGILAKWLDRAGEERFLAKASGFQADIVRMGASQSIYHGIMGALGYAKNKFPFQELAQRLPLQILESMTRDTITEEEALAQQQALLLGTAGLLPSQRSNWYQENRPNDKWTNRLEKVWVSCHLTDTMPESAWHLFRVRPNNSPVRRIIAMSYLVLRYKKRGILEEVASIIEEIPLSKGPQRLEESLIVTNHGYWVSHLGSDLNSKLKSQGLLGRNRAADIVVNVLLPFTFAWSKFTSHPELGQKSFDLYRSYPKLTVNRVDRHMSNQLKLSSDLVNSAQRQQGLIHIYNTLCTQGKCCCCPLGNYLYVILTPTLVATHPRNVLRPPAYRNRTGYLP